ncbi:plant invertase/pectin methylesterase inhibitor [Striga asiatica]|uniref:Plant invertase/pectin methylesterase inhibitor n=1 Tax=Striga asiatica TaxID=4170 RepID=A0A5A7QS25_STRAF|nr:plant invertase/pectin methylesterase inhibitor [Striga asiatica]
METLHSNITKPYLLTLLLLLLLTSNPKISCSKVPKSYTNFIKKSCNSTTYPTVCTKTLFRYAAAVRANPFRLCTAALSVATQSARDCSAIVTGLAARKDVSRPEARVLKDCMWGLKDAVYQLRRTAGAMAQLGGADREFQWGNAKTYASAAITDADTCVDGLFEGRKVGRAMRSRIKGCVSDVERRISNALYLINHLY